MRLLEGSLRHGVAVCGVHLLMGFLESVKSLNYFDLLALDVSVILFLLVHNDIFGDVSLKKTLCGFLPVGLSLA